MKKLIFIPLSLFLTITIFSQVQSRSKYLAPKENKISTADTNINRHKLPTTLKFKWTNLFISQSHSLISSVKINGKEDKEAFDDNQNFHPWVDKKIDIGLWKSLNRYIWGGVDYSIAANQLNLNYNHSYDFGPSNNGTFFYKLKTSSLINSVSGKLGFGYAFSSSDWNKSRNKFMLCALVYMGFRSNIISSNIQDNGSVLASNFSGNYTIRDTTLTSRTSYMSTNNLASGFIVQFSYLGVSFNGSIERDYTTLPIGVYTSDKVVMRNVYIKLGLGLAL